jgi:hypothetical protein
MTPVKVAGIAEEEELVALEEVDEENTPEEDVTELVVLDDGVEDVAVELVVLDEGVEDVAVEPVALDDTDE